LNGADFEDHDPAFDSDAGLGFQYEFHDDGSPDGGLEPAYERIYCAAENHLARVIRTWIRDPEAYLKQQATRGSKRRPRGAAEWYIQRVKRRIEEAAQYNYLFSGTRAENEAAGAAGFQRVLMENYLHELDEAPFLF
jgi:hypothetical protein